MHHRAFEENVLLWEGNGRASAASSRVCGARLGSSEIGIWRGCSLRCLDLPA